MPMRIWHICGVSEKSVSTKKDNRYSSLFSHPSSFCFPVSNTNRQNKNPLQQNWRYEVSSIRTIFKGSCFSIRWTFADYLWIKAIVYFGKHFETDKSCRWFYHLLDVVSTLDPYFESAYEIGGVTLAYWEKDENLSIKLLKKGMTNVPKTHERDWRILFFLAIITWIIKKILPLPRITWKKPSNNRDTRDIFRFWLLAFIPIPKILKLPLNS